MDIALQQLIAALAGKSDHRTHVHISEFVQMPLYMVSRKQLLDELFRPDRYFSEEQVNEIGRETLTALAEEYLKGLR
jgi:CRISPR/Cas system-associated protein Csm6